MNFLSVCHKIQYDFYISHAYLYEVFLFLTYLTMYRYDVTVILHPISAKFRDFLHLSI